MGSGCQILVIKYCVIGHLGLEGHANYRCLQNVSCMTYLKYRFYIKHVQKDQKIDDSN